eukprot:872427-Pelagomonas_calceolata.AAC.1
MGITTQAETALPTSNQEKEATILPDWISLHVDFYFSYAQPSRMKLGFKDQDTLTIADETSSTKRPPQKLSTVRWPSKKRPWMERVSL